MSHFFFFGTLLDRDLLSCVLDRRVDDTRYLPARLAGYRVVRLKDEVYPMLAVDPSASVEGAVIDGLDDTDLARIVFYESVEYAPLKVTVETHGGGPVEANAFVGSARAVPGARPWSFGEWKRAEKALAEIEARVWMKFYGQCDVATADRIWDEWRDAGNAISDLERAIPDLLNCVSSR